LCPPFDPNHLQFRKMKSWADYCSSDEESLDDLPEQMEAQKLSEVEPVDPTTDGPPPTTTTEDEVDGPAAEDAPPAAPRTYDFPDKPPFTAFIGNLAYSLKEPEELIAAVKQCALEVLGQEINLLGARISFGRDGSHRGFGYLEVETLDELKLLMQLNDGTGTIAGRKVQLDTANGNQNKRGSHQRRQQGDSNVDGSRFRGGKFNNRRNNNNSNISNKEEGPPKERPSLKLAPRTKPKEDEKGESQGPSDIFGGARARDAQAWEENRKPSRQQNGDNQQKNDGDRRRPNQAGRGGRGGGRTSGRGGNSTTTNSNNNSEGGGKRGPQGKREPKQKLISPEEKAAAAAAAAKAEVPAPTPAASAKPAAPTNKFALLMDSDSD
jgi:hypothetical protein